MINKSYFLLFFFCMISCKSFQPFNSKKNKSEALNEIIKKYLLTNKEKQMLKNQDSVLFLLSSYKKDVVSKKLTQRRLDSFFKGNYNRKELWLFLALDRDFPNKKPFERDYNATINKPLQISSYKEMVNKIKSMDSLLAKKLNIKHKDSL